MKVTNLSPIRTDGGIFTQAANFLMGSIRYGSAWFDDVEAQKIVIEQLDRVLDRRFVVLQNMPLKGSEFPIPLLLIGPTGISLIHVHAGKGIFRAKETTWTKLNHRTGKFEESENLIARTLEMQKAVEDYLSRHHYSHPPIQAVLLFTHPGTHVDAIRPAVRIVLRDALDRLGLSILQDPVVLNYQEVHRLEGAFDTSASIAPKTEPRPQRASPPKKNGRPPAQPSRPAIPTGFERLDKYASPKKAGGKKSASAGKPIVRAAQSVFVDDGELGELLGISDWETFPPPKAPPPQPSAPVFTDESSPQSLQAVPAEPQAQPAERSAPSTAAFIPASPRPSIWSRTGKVFGQVENFVTNQVGLKLWQLFALALLGLVILCLAFGVVMLILLYS